MQTNDAQGGIPLHVQYQVASARRQSFDTLMWQTPVVSLTGLAFLFLIALGAGTSPLARCIASALAFLSAVFSAQLLAKHRYYETYWAGWLERFERDHNLITISANPPSPRGWLLRRSSYRLWLALFIAFAVAALSAFLIALCEPQWLNTSPAG